MQAGCASLVQAQIGMPGNEASQKLLGVVAARERGCLCADSWLRLRRTTARCTVRRSLLNKQVLPNQPDIVAPYDFGPAASSR